MPNDKTKASLETLPVEHAVKIASFLEKTDIENVSLASSATYRIFQLSKPDYIATKLIYLIIQADYDKVKNLININSHSMFHKIHFTYGNNEHISPLQYAFKLYDTYMWKMFYEHIKDDKYASKLFLQQAKEQKEHVNIDLVISAYSTYVKDYVRWVKKEITEIDLSNSWINIGKNMLENLPRHMLYDFCREGVVLNKNSSFNTRHASPPTPPVIKGFNEATFLNKKTNKYEINKKRCRGLGISTILARKNSDNQVVCIEAADPCNRNERRDYAKNNSEIIQLLFSVRRNELETYIRESTAQLSSEISVNNAESCNKPR